MKRQNLGMALFVIGPVLVLLSLMADNIGLGSSAGFGLWQWGGAILGILLVVLGGFLRGRSVIERGRPIR